MTTLTATGQKEMHVDFAPFMPGFDYAQAGNLEDTLQKLDARCRRDDGNDSGRGRRQHAGKGVCHGSGRLLPCARYPHHRRRGPDRCRAHGSFLMLRALRAAPRQLSQWPKGWAVGCPSAQCCCRKRCRASFRRIARVDVWRQPHCLRRRAGCAEADGRRLYAGCGAQGRNDEKGPAQHAGCRSSQRLRADDWRFPEAGDGEGSGGEMLGKGADCS